MRELAERCRLPERRSGECAVEARGRHIYKAKNACSKLKLRLLCRMRVASILGKAKNVARVDPGPARASRDSRVNTPVARGTLRFRTPIL